MQEILLWSIFGIAAVFFGLTLLIVVNKAWRESVQRYQRIRRRVLEPQVLSYAHGGEVSLRAALGHELRPGDRAVLESILLDHAQRVRGSAHEKLARALVEMGYVDGYLLALRSRRWWRRAQAAERLGLASAELATEALIRALRDEVPDVRMRAAKALGAVGGTESARELIGALNEPNRWSSIRIADVLTGMGSDVVDELISSFDSLELPGKLAVLDVLGRIRPLHVVNWLTIRLGDPDADVRARAAHALGSIGDPRSVASLVDAVSDPAWPVRAMAVKALGRVGDPGAIPALRQAMGDAEWWVRSNAAHALRQMADGVQVLEEMLDSRDRYARDQAVLMLEEMGVVDQRLQGLLGDSPTEQSRAVVFVGRLVRAGQTGRLLELAERSARPGLQSALRALIDGDSAAEGAGR